MNRCDGSLQDACSLVLDIISFRLLFFVNIYSVVAIVYSNII